MVTWSHRKQVRLTATYRGARVPLLLPVVRVLGPELAGITFSGGKPVSPPHNALPGLSERLQGCPRDLPRTVGSIALWTDPPYEARTAARRAKSGTRRPRTRRRPCVPWPA